MLISEMNHIPASRHFGRFVATLVGTGILAISSYAQEVTPNFTALTDTTQVNVEPQPVIIEEKEDPNVVRSTRKVTLVPGAQYQESGAYNFFFGEGYRDVWTSTVSVPEIDLERTAGGLTVLQAGGGLQTESLRLRGANGQEYQLRSVNKNVQRSLPDYFRGTLVGDLAQDQIAASHPYSALVIPTLAQAAGILHVVPSLVVIPDSPRLGEHRERFAGMLAFFEKRPDENQANDPRLGRSKNVIGFEKLIEQIEEDNDRHVDEHAFARVRLFDMLVGDWDRHDDQFRWAEFEEKDQTRYVAVPRDRDFAFSLFEGALTSIARLSGGSGPRRLGHFDEDINDIVGLNFKGAKLDLRFTSSLDREDWIREAEYLRRTITDDVIDRAVRNMPEAAYTESGSEIARLLKSRRDQLVQAASAYYEKLALKVDVVGSDKHDLFEVHRMDNGAMHLTVHKTDRAGVVGPMLWERTFHPNETREVRIYGLDGNDRFVITGESKEGPRLRAIGGEGDDVFVDRSYVKGTSRKNQFYDRQNGNLWELGRESRLHNVTDTTLNRYQMHRYEFNQTFPRISVAYSNEDGIFIGGGASHVRPGFGKVPFAARHTATANYAPQTSEYNLRYRGEFIRVRYGWDALVNASVLSAGDFRYFYGFGNETVGTRASRELYRSEMQWGTVSSMLGRHLAPNLYFSIGPRFQYVNVDQPNGFTPGGRGSALTPEQYVDKYYVSGATNLTLDTRDSHLYPRTGVRWISDASYNAGVRNTNNQFVQVGSELSLYHTFRPFTVALRAGGAHNFGDFEFYHANVVGGNEQLRGFRRMRFAGRSSAYANAELRLPLFQLNTYLTKGDFGVLGFVDHGRVWWDNESSDRVHQGYGGGVFYSPYNAFMLTGTVSASKEEKMLFNVGMGFLF